jgi:hypothetical protein
VFGIPCRLRTSAARAALRQVLAQIGDRFPRDFARLQALVREVRPLPQRDHEDGTLGWWKAEAPLDPFTSEGLYRQLSCEGRDRGTLFIWERQDTPKLTANIAHELGHAVTGDDDLRRRGEVHSDEWASELTADWYAYKRGFGRLIARYRKQRDWGHHSPGPGKGFSRAVDGVQYFYRISRNFRVRLVSHRKLTSAEWQAWQTPE